jgi:dTDP-4-dehydrorhamnose 3,5-epimerase
LSQFTFFETPLEGLKVLKRQQIGDVRGSLSRMFCAQELSYFGWKKPIAQINHTYTKKLGTIRGMHFQRPPCGEMKLVYCLSGAVWDVALDIRRGSSTFLQWYAQEITATNLIAMLIPEGFAHGFQSLTDDCELLYLHSHSYAPADEAGINPEDPLLSINWPHAAVEISARDRMHAPITLDFEGVSL